MNGFLRAGAAALVAAAAFVAGGTTAASAASAPVWLAAGPTAGGLGLDEDLADYRWDTRPAAQWGGRVLAGRGAFALGLCAWRSGTTQATGLPGVTVEPSVALTTVSATALARVAAPLGCEVWLGALAGRLHAGWEPGTLVVAAGGEPVAVEFRDVDEWCTGLVFEVQRRLGRGLVASLQGERSTFALDTAHRRGDAIVAGRDRFGVWAARLQVAWRWSL